MTSTTPETTDFYRRAIRDTIREVTTYSENKPVSQGGTAGFLRSELFFLGDRIDADYDIHSSPAEDGSGTVLKTSLRNGPELTVLPNGQVSFGGKTMKHSTAFRAAAEQIINLVRQEKQSLAQLTASTPPRPKTP